MKYPDDFINKVIQGDCLEVMKEIETNSIDTVITDPPYGLEFMGKEWDKFGKQKLDIWGKGGVLPDNVPRFRRISNESWKVFQRWTEQWARETLRVAKPGATLLCFGGTRTYHRMACAIEDAGWILKDCIMWLYGSGFPKATDISKQLDKKAGKKGKVVGTEKIDIGIQKGSMHAGRKLEVVDRDITEPATPEAKLWNGWKSHGLKPAYEPIIVAMKPNEGSYAENALKYGVAGLNIDEGRIEHEEIKKTKRDKRKTETWEEGSGFKNEENTLASASPKGRFPANIILDEEAAKMLDEQSGKLKSGDNCERTKEGFFGEHGGLGKAGDIQITYGDTGGASRFFYVAKASKSERNMGCEGLENRQTTGGGGGIGDYKNDVNSMSGKYGSEKAPAKNNHPTVKPLKLMEYLCILTKTPTGGIVLDPFAGSGTTGLACQNTGRDYILIEKEKEYCEIAKARLSRKRQKSLL